MAKRSENKKISDKKFIPKKDAEYIVTDSCFWNEEAPDDYNPLDETRFPHYMQLVDKKSGTMVNLPSGSVVKVVKVKEH